MSDSLQPHGLYSPGNSPGQNTLVGSLSLLQGIFPTQELNSGLLHYRRILYQLSHKGSPILCIRNCKASEVQLASSHLTVTTIHWTWRKSVAWVIFCLTVGKLETVVSVRRKMGDGRGNNRVVGRGCHVGLQYPTRIQWWSLLWGEGAPLCYRDSHLYQQPAGLFITVTSYNSKTDQDYYANFL